MRRKALTRQLSGLAPDRFVAAFQYDLGPALGQRQKRDIQPKLAQAPRCMKIRPARLPADRNRDCHATNDAKHS